MIICLDKQVAQDTFDIAIHSMDFGSGFLDNAQVDALRAMAEYLGVDPREATPEEHRRRYCTGHEWRKVRDYYGDRIYWKCEVCRTFQVSAEVPDVRLGIPS